jgi:hypothetical protein
MSGTPPLPVETILVADPSECALCGVSFSRWNREADTDLCRGCHANVHIVDELTEILQRRNERPAAGAPTVDEAPVRGLTLTEGDTPRREG